MDRETELDNEIAELEKEIYGTPEEDSPVEEVVQEAIEVTEAVEDNPTVTEPIEDPQETPKAKRINWKKRFINLKSSQDATIYSLRTDNANLKAQLLELDAKVSNMVSNVKTDDPFDTLFTEEDKDVLGEEALDIFTKASKAAVDSAVSPLKAKLEEEKQHRVKQQQIEVRDQRKAADTIFLEKLGNLVPDYDELDYDPGFKKWMDEPDTYSGFQRKQLLHNAKNSGDVVRVAEFFVEYQQLTASPREESNKALEKAVGPTGSNASQVNTEQKFRTYTMTEVEAFYDSVNRGKYIGKESEAKALEAKYDKAFAEGRIR